MTHENTPTARSFARAEVHLVRAWDAVQDLLPALSGVDHELGELTAGKIVDTLIDLSLLRAPEASGSPEDER